MKKKYSKLLKGSLVLPFIFLISSCSSNQDIANNNNGSSNSKSNSNVSVESGDNEVVTSVNEDVNNQDFTITTSDGEVSVSDNVYLITSGGTYTLSGTLNGEIRVMVNKANSESSYDVLLELNGLTLTNSETSPITILESSDSSISYNVEISAKKDTTNIIKDLREEESDYKAAIYSLVDLKLKGKGVLYVSSSNNGGVYTKDDLEIKNLTLTVNSKDDALQGNDSVSIESGLLTIISTGKDGIKTTNSGVSSKGNQKGIVNISGGTITIYSCQDGIDCAYDVLVSSTADIEIYTSNYSKYSGEVVSSDSKTLYLRSKESNYHYAAYFYNSDGTYKFVEATSIQTSYQRGNSYTYYELGIPSGYSNVKYYCFSSSQSVNVDNYVAVSEGLTINEAYNLVTLSRSSQTLSISYSTYQTQTQSGGFGSFGPGAMNQGNTEKSEYSAKGIKAANQIEITGGDLLIQSYDDGIHSNSDQIIESTNQNGLGNINISGGTINIYSKDDGLHADSNLVISDLANINISEAYEGIEANQIYFNGGTTKVYAKDDAVNAAKCGKSVTPCIYVKDGAFVDLDCMSGDTDTMDSNGNISITGGVVVLKNRSSQSTSMTGGTIDLDGTFSIIGGILISFGTWCNEVNQTATYQSSSQVSKGTYQVKDSSGNLILETTLDTTYQGYRIISKLTGSYTLYKDLTKLTTF